MPVRAKHVNELSSPEDGGRVLVMYFYPRGIRREAFHEWYRELGTAPELIKAWKLVRITWGDFSRRYIAQLAASSQAQATLNNLAQRAQKEVITQLCARRDEQHCHRTLLKALIEERTEQVARQEEHYEGNHRSCL